MGIRQFPDILVSDTVDLWTSAIVYCWTQWIGSNIITSSGHKLEAKEGAHYIQEKQLEGLACLAKNKIEYKVNTILIPRINENQIKDIAKTIADYNASLHNIVPFIPLGKLKALGAPSSTNLIAARRASEEHIKQFRLCKQCPSDAFDIPGMRVSCH